MKVDTAGEYIQTDSLGMLSFSLCVVLLVFNARPSGANNKHLICKQGEDVFSANDAPGTLPSGGDYRQGRPGRIDPQGVAGPPGAHGLEGPQGQPGVVDYAKVTATIGEKVDPVIAILEATIQEMKTQIDELESRPVIARLEATIQEMKTQIRELESRPGIRGITYEGKCYWVVLEEDTTFPKAVEICKNNSGSPADIYGSTQYDLIMKHVRRIIGDREFVDLWLGMKVDTTERTVTQSNGVSAPFLRWHPNDPDFLPTWENVAVRIRSDEDSPNQGKFNNPPTTYPRNGVICEI